MSCCADPRAVISLGAGTLPDAFASAVRVIGGRHQLALHVPDIHCAACIGRIERALGTLADSVDARVNLTRRTVTVEWDDPLFDPAVAVAALRDLGYAPQPVAEAARGEDVRGRELLRAMAVAGFAAMNVMLLSVAVWSGADGSTRTFLNWFAALIALPALTYAARPFLRSALAALSQRQLNMDVPISLAIVLAAALSLAKTVSGTGETYFDAAVMLTFFLLVGRYLDHLSRERARASVSRLAALAAPVAHRVEGEHVNPVPLPAVAPGDRLEVAAGERVPVDGRIERGEGAFDVSLATGESDPVECWPGDEVVSGALALSGPVRLVALRPAADSYLARLSALQAAAEAARSPTARLADRAARVYAPVVHLVALVTVLGWMAAGASFGTALETGIAVLIITCPCALGLAVPVVHVAACDRLFRAGIALKDGTVLERLRHIDSVVFDKTGTLTMPELDPAAPVDDRALAVAAALARHSTHPKARAVLRAAEARGLALPPVTEVREQRGQGIEGVVAGRRAFLGADPRKGANGLALVEDGTAPLPLPVVEHVRPGARRLVERIAAWGLPQRIVSGDREPAVAAVAADLGISEFSAETSPDAKMASLAKAVAQGKRPLMVGDGLNDGPALAAAYVSAAPAEASELARTAADIVLIGDRLDALVDAVSVARRAHRLVLQNFAVAFGYNLVAIPLAVLGHASPLVAALAMSSSSIVVTLNALRVQRGADVPASPRRAEGSPPPLASAPAAA